MCSSAIKRSKTYKNFYIYFADFSPRGCDYIWKIILCNILHKRWLPLLPPHHGFDWVSHPAILKKTIPTVMNQLWHRSDCQYQESTLLLPHSRLLEQNDCPSRLILQGGLMTKNAKILFTHYSARTATHSKKKSGNLHYALTIWSAGWSGRTRQLSI